MGDFYDSDQDDYDDVHDFQMDGDTVEECSFFHDFKNVPSRKDRMEYINQLMRGRADGDWLLRCGDLQGISSLALICASLGPFVDTVSSL